MNKKNACFSTSCQVVEKQAMKALINSDYLTLIDVTTFSKVEIYFSFIGA